MGPSLALSGQTYTKQISYRSYDHPRSVQTSECVKFIAKYLACMTAKTPKILEKITDSPLITWGVNINRINRRQSIQVLQKILRHYIPILDEI